MEHRGPYQRFLLATAVSSLGDGLLVTGLPLLARNATSSAFLVSAVFAGGRVPWAIGLLIGAFADRREARSVMIRADLARGAVLALLGFGLLINGGEVPVLALICLSALLSAGQILFFAASQRAVPFLVPSAELEKANGQFSAITTAGEQFVGPAAGAVFLTGGLLPVFGDAASFAGSAALLRDLPEIPPEPTTSRLVDDTREGWHWFRADPMVRLITIMMTLTACLSGGVIATEVILIRDTLKLSSWWFGGFTAVMALGSIVGSMAAPWLIQRLGKSSMSVALSMTALSYLFCAGTNVAALVFIGMFMQQAFTMVGIVASVSIRQRAIPDRLRGRVISLSRSFAYGSQIGGGLAGGWVAEQYGTGTLFAIAGGLTLMVALATARPLMAELSRWSAAQARKLG